MPRLLTGRLDTKCWGQRFCIWNHQTAIKAAAKQQKTLCSVLATVRYSSSSNTTTSSDNATQKPAFQDPVLSWASQNRQVAQACLDRPSEDEVLRDSDNDNSGMNLDSLNTFEDYWKWRRWDFSSASPGQETTFAHSLTTHILSDPVSLSMLLLKCQQQSSSSKNKWSRNTLRLCCLGARSEASLPVFYWKEILLLLARRHGLSRPPPLDQENDNPQDNENDNENDATKIHLTLDFVGPEVLTRPKVKLHCDGVGSITLRWLYNGKFHQFLQTLQERKTQPEPTLPHSYWDAFVLFNPGLGHANLRDDWKPTLDMLLSSDLAPTRPPMLLTAHSWKDAQRDGLVLTDYLLDRAPLYQRNPWASRVQYLDPLDPDDDQHMVQSNLFYHVIGNEF